MRGKPYAILYLWTSKHTSKAIIDGSPGEIVVQFNVARMTLRACKFVVFAALRIEHASFAREALRPMTPDHANPGEQPQPSEVRSQENGR
jgi:hypothetical protein